MTPGFSFEAYGFRPLRPSNLATLVSTLTTGYLYQHEHMAADGTPLFVDCRYSPTTFRLTVLPHSQSPAHIVAVLPYSQPELLEAAISAFFQQHGGIR